MHHAARVPLRKSVRDLCGDLDGPPHAETHAGHLVAQRWSCRELVREIADAVLLDDVEERCDVGVIERAGDACALDETRAARGIRQKLRRRLHQSDRPADLRVTRTVHVTERAAPEALEDVVVRDLLGTGVVYFLAGKGEAPRGSEGFWLGARADRSPPPRRPPVRASNPLPPHVRRSRSRPSPA